MCQKMRMMRLKNQNFAVFPANLTYLTIYYLHCNFSRTVCSSPTQLFKHAVITLNHQQTS